MVASGRYQACGAYDLPLVPIIVVCCGTSPPGDGPRGIRSQITLRAKPTADWRLASSPSIDEVKGTDACNLSAARVPATALVEGQVRNVLEANLGKLAARLSEVDFRNHAQPLWDAAQQPIPLANTTWLVLNPSRVSVGAPSGDGTVVTVRAALAAQPVVVAGTRPSVTPRPLPAQLDTAGAAEQFSIILEGRLSSPAADRQVQDLLVGRRVVQGDKYIQITAAHLYGSGGNAVALEVAFAGSAKGTIYFVGTPQLNSGTGELAVPDLDYDVDTKNALVQAANWLLHPTVREFFASRAKWQSAPVLEQARQEANRSIANGSAGKVRWQGELRTLQASSVLVTPTEIVARVVATGALAVSVAP